MLTRLFKFKDFEVFGEERGLKRGQDFWQAADYIMQAIKELSRL